MYAAELSRIDIIESILKAGARIDECNDSGATACHAAVTYRHVDALKLLLTHGPNLAQLDANGHGLVEYSLRYTEEEKIWIMLVEAGAPLNDIPANLMSLFATRSTTALQSLINRGVVLSDTRDFEGKTPLHSAVHKRDCGAVLDMLINVCQVDLEARDVYGYTCTHVAAYVGNFVALCHFIAGGADVQCLASDQRTPLHMVSDRNSYECTVLLLGAGADVHAVDRAGTTAARAAAAESGDSVKNALLAADANLCGPLGVSVVDHNGVATARREIAAARRELSKLRLDIVRKRALQVCIGLQSRGLDSLQMCEILVHACGPVATVIAFHQWWEIAVTVKHFKSQSQLQSQV
jgi:ankyrin repeat protein